ncbi:MAG: hypothetical protein QHJ73_02650 [Armatimonadota bacterium]|nr:hypothetical protein [Armatimonadota bacterium]
MKSALVFSTLCLALAAGGAAGAEGKAHPGAEIVRYAGYDDCIRLFNSTTQVVLCPAAGGRVLDYSLDGRNVLYRDPAQDGWTYTPGERAPDPCGGRCDIGPEMVVPRHPNLWLGRWQGVITGPRAARLTSVPDPATGVQLVRHFALDARTSRLRFTQTIRNVSNEKKEWCHWSRTLAVGNGICVVPLNPRSRFPNGFLLYGPGPVMNYRPEPEPNIRLRDGFLEIAGPPSQPKFGIDSIAGWLGYVTRDNILFAKRFPVYPDRVYNEMAAYTVSIYYFKEQMCELEPIGPRGNIRPGGSESFTEEWWLFPYAFPKEGEALDLKALERFVLTRTR